MRSTCSSSKSHVFSLNINLLYKFKNVQVYLVIQKISQMKYVMQKKRMLKQTNKQYMHIDLKAFLAIKGCLDGMI